MPTLEILGQDTRTLRFTREAVNEDGTIEISFSSETDQVERWFGIEILCHEPGAMDMTRAALGLPFLLNHDPDNLLGRVENIRVGTDRKGRGTVRFSSSPEAQQVRQDMLDGIRPDISVGYLRLAETTQKGQGNAPDVVTITSWMPFEITSASIPADISVGAGRSATLPATPAGHLEDRNMPEPNTPQAAPVAATPTPIPEPEVRNLISPEIRGFLVSAEKAFGADGRRAAEEILSQTQDLGRAGLELIKRFESKPLPAPAPSLQDLGASERELKNYSYARALASLVDQAEGRQGTRGFEHEISDTLVRSMPLSFKSNGGIIVPMQLRALTTSTVGAGKELIFNEKGELIPLLRNMAVVLKLGARFITGLTGPLVFPKVTAGGAANWVAENSGEDVPDTEFTTGTVTLSPKTLQANTPISRQLLYTASEDAEAMVREDLAKAHALAFDKGAIHGTGANNQPTGIYTAAGANVVAMGGAPTHGKLVDMITEIAADNALLGTIGYVTNPRVAGKLMQTLVAAAAGSAMIWTGKIEEGLLNGYRAIASNQLASNLGGGANEHGLVCGDFAQVLIGQFGPGFELILDPYAKKKQGLVEFTSFQMGDVALRYPEAFTKATGLILT
jgi:HK97 family phage major capsid protein